MTAYVCQYCGKDTSAVEYDYLTGYDHLSCALEAQPKDSNEYETCVLCGTKTAYKKDVHIDFRVGYIEGAGQLCIKCYSGGTDRNLITVPASTIYNTPNDQELGSKVRRIYYDQKDNS